MSRAVATGDTSSAFREANSAEVDAGRVEKRVPKVKDCKTGSVRDQQRTMYESYFPGKKRKTRRTAGSNDIKTGKGTGGECP
jgi:hypothetical protein